MIVSETLFGTAQPATSIGFSNPITSMSALNPENNIFIFKILNTAYSEFRQHNMKFRSLKKIQKTIFCLYLYLIYKMIITYKPNDGKHGPHNMKDAVHQPEDLTDPDPTTLTATFLNNIHYTSH